MSRLSTIARRKGQRKPPAQEQQLPAIHAYRDRLDRLADTTYQVLHWVRVHPADLSAEELTWHGIASDIDPTTGTVAYSRGGRPMSPETTVGPVQDSTRLPHHQERTQEPGRRCCPPHPARI